MREVESWPRWLGKQLRFVSSPRALKLQPDFGVIERKTFDANHFVPGLVTANETDGASGQLQFFRKKFQQRLVGPPLQRGGMDFDLQCIAQPARDFIARGVGHRLQFEGTERHGGETARSVVNEKGKTCCARPAKR